MARHALLFITILGLVGVLYAAEGSVSQHAPQAEEIAEAGTLVIHDSGGGVNMVAW